ncbi:MAG TPA: 23S rRNA (adenine(2503)-C(2))-methyltransferase RlmN [Bacilli bacterium]|nr:23S rRNA (adenine(2503)-C(2))-methyltransferase RlmN [Bacilli bacterium]
MKTNIFNYTHEQLTEKLLSLGEKKFRATQLFSWIYEKNVLDFQEMSDISKSSIALLQEHFTFDLPRLHSRQDSSDGTIKLLLELNDGALIETVLMRYEYGNSVCVTSQVGCNMGCKFCASGLLKKKRDLTSGEMLGQVYTVNTMLKEEDAKGRVSHVVIMGIGEPFDNYDNIMSFIRIINHPKAFAIGARHITVSTCGIVPRIKQFAHEGIQVKLAISLHGPTDEIRSKIMPINNRYPVDEVIEAAKYYESVTNKRVTFEYILIDGVNDSLSEAKALVALVKDMLAFVNLIPYNPVDEHGFKRSKQSSQRAFFDYLMQNGVNTTLRKEFGSDIDAACGQLRAKKEKERDA